MHGAVGQTRETPAMRRTLTCLAIVLTSAFALGCSSADDGSDPEEEDLTSGATRIAKSLEGPGNAVVSGDVLVFSTAHFEASGDPELDQEFASWHGQLWMKPIPSGQKSKMADTAGAVTDHVMVGSSLLVVDSTYLGVTRYALPSGKESDFYNDFAHFPNQGEDGDTLGGIAAGKSGVYITRPGSEVMSMKTDGSGVKQFAKTWKSGWVEMARKIVVLDDAVFWSSEQEGEKGSTFNLYRATVSGSHTPVKLATFESGVSSMATDGKDVYIVVSTGQGETGRIAVVPGDGSKAPRTLVEVKSADNLVYDDRFGLFYTDWSKGVELFSKSALSSTKPAPSHVLSVSGPTSIALSKDQLYVTADTGQINEKKGELLRYPLSKITVK